ncbi:MAG: Ig-like domain-containing protein [Caldilineaceae bacterium]
MAPASCLSDTTPPIPSISAPATHDGSTAFNVTVDFGEDVTGFDGNDLTVANGTVNSMTGGPQSYTVQITPDGSNGDITIDIAAAAAQDGANNDSSAASQQTVTYSAAIPPIMVPAAVTGTEDSAILLGITVAPALLQGGAQYDIIGTEAGFRDASAGATPTTFTIPANTAAVRITAYGGNDNGGGTGSGDQEDYQTMSMLVDLVAGSYSGHIIHITGQSDANNDNYTFANVALGSASASGSPIGDTSNNFNSVTVDLSGSTLSIVESQARADQAYLVEYLGATASSANFVESLGDVMAVNDISTTLSLSSSVDFVILSILEGRGGLSSTQEDKGLSRLVVDLDSSMASGVLFNQKGRGDSFTAAYAFTGYDITSGAPIQSNVTAVGDTSAAADVLPNLTIIRSGNDLIISRTADTCRNLYCPR